jgi:branched-chain amino acid transport system permease protein
MAATVLVYGFVNSVILALTAAGFALTYGVSRIANFAHGALYVLGGFAAWALLHRAGAPYPVAAGLAVAGTALLGAALYRLVLIRVRGLPLAEVIVTFALGIAALELLRFFGFFGSAYGLPPVATGTVRVLGVPLDAQRVVVSVVGPAVTVGLWHFSHRTRAGLALQAIAQDEEAALTLGIDPDVAATLSMALGGGLAALAAVVVVPLGFLAAESGATVLITAVAVCIVGGLGSPAGVLVASLLVGYAQIVSVVLLGPHYQMIVALLAILVTLIVRPSGLFGVHKTLEERV